MDYKYSAKIISVYDGDTVTAEIDLGFSVKVTERMRLYDINAPEMRGGSDEDKAAGKASRDRLRELVLDKTVIVETLKDKKGKFGRYIATLWVEPREVFETTADVRRHEFLLSQSGVNINKLLVAEGHAVFKEY